MTRTATLDRHDTVYRGAYWDVACASADVKTTHHFVAGPDGEPHSTEQKDDLP